ncbi:alpha/beta hydrolase [Hyphomicrobium sp.]|uniref:alpha/beta hydrolase n=1 Tax=Hyphomicrobium sp. TaxID=82 RepID=UPI002E336C4C|nr:alpha/beta fold hydrolase [Hyphomicrobium sp.]HEX2840335.1 alpha/beta fold hydrolase [Hyphomicrobium sp.]
MTLEVLRARGSGTPRTTDILLVHGIFVGAWVWEKTFMPYLANAGYTVHSVSLSGHGASCGHERIGALTLADYSADVIEAAASIGRPVVAVGHSMGGAAVQDAVRRGARFAGAALLASVPPGGLMAANFSMMWSRPRLWRELSLMFSTGLGGIDMDVLRDGLFSNRIDAASFAHFAARGGQESSLVGYELQGLRPFAPMPWQAPPMLVMGGTEDRLIRKEDLWATAAWYGVQAQFLPGLSHSLMLDPDWQLAADCLLHWLDAVAPLEDDGPRMPPTGATLDTSAL